MKKRIHTFIMVIMTIQSLVWGQVTLRDAFANAPDEIFPLLTRNNRLDCMDFAESNVKMEVNNIADGKTRIDSLTQNYMRIRMTDRNRVEVYLQHPANQDSARICLIRTYLGPAEDSHVSIYDTNWRLLGEVERPQAETFFDENLGREARGILADLSLMHATFTQNGDSLIWTISTTELNKEQKKTAEGHTHSIICPIVIKKQKK
ncbi:MAG: DUF3256 family protein [Bacteroidaceae bacterium]